jgi:hypothetical protein
MSRRSNLTTLRTNKISLNLSNFNNKFYVLGLNFLKTFKQLLLQKRIFVFNENLNFFCNKIYLKSSFFFEAHKLKSYKKKTKKKLKKIKKKITIIPNLIENLSKLFNINSIITNFEVINNKMNSKLFSFLSTRFQYIVFMLFSRRLNLYLDFIKLTALYSENKVDLNTYLYVLMQIFKYLRKQQHSAYFKFLLILFNVLIFNVAKMKNIKSKIKGIKIIIGGRLKGKQKAKTQTIKLGLVPIQTLYKNIEFAKGYTFTRNFGVYGFKIWVYKN